MVGGDYVGLEVAAACQQNGFKVTVVKAAKRILQRVAAPEISAVIQNAHLARGVVVYTGVWLTRLEGESGK